MNKTVLLLFFALSRLWAQSETNASGGTFSNSAISIEWSINSGLQNPLFEGVEILKMGILQPILKKIVIKSDTLQIYNFITANADGKNDFFTIEGLKSATPHDLKIFNRLGNVIYHSTAYTNDWDGDEVEPGTYFYLLKYNDIEVKNVIFLSK